MSRRASRSGPIRQPALLDIAAARVADLAVVNVIGLEAEPSRLVVATI